ncbi:hypothetical protein MXB_4572 [Myxobolus squamalis]|nr:hypothetical protein MXB_4572 [Myxobolus squamalis]
MVICRFASGLYVFTLKIFGIDTCLVFPVFLTVQNLESVICVILSSNVVLPLYREVTIVPTKEILASIDLSKKTKDIIDYGQLANTTFITYHKQRRDYFTATLRETRQIVLSQPGILGPKFDKILQILSFVFESVYLWFLHYSSDVYKSKKIIGEIYDLSVLTSIYEVLEMRNVILKYNTVVKRYYRSFIGEYDRQALAHYKLLKDSGKLHFDDLDLSYYEGFQKLCDHFKDTPFSDSEGLNPMTHFYPCD